MKTCAQWINNDFVITIKSFEYNSRDSHNTIGALNRVAEVKPVNNSTTHTLYIHIICIFYQSMK